MSVERTFITIAPKEWIEADPEVIFGVYLEDEIDEHEVREAVLRSGVEYWEIDRRTTETNWGASGASSSLLIEFAAHVVDESVWIVVGILIDRLVGRAKRRDVVPEADDALRHARRYIATAYKDESIGDLPEAGDGFDHAAGTRTVVVDSATHRYEITLRATAKGVPFVSASRREKHVKSDS